MLCEALTQLPHSLVFNEPNLSSRNFIVRANEAALLESTGIDLQRFVKRWSRGRRQLLLYGFRKRLVPRISRHIAQVGVKEIFHSNWRRLVEGFPDTRIVLSARDPRDIYLSLRGRYMTGAAIWHGDFTPRNVAQSLNSEFVYQQEMARRHNALKVRYEDLCLRPASIQQVLKFVESDITAISELGDFLRADAQRVAEGQLHGGQITDKRVARWRHESDKLANEAQQVFDSMKDYCEFWNYSQEGPLELGESLSQNLLAT